jgi:hypothetical protein
LGFFVAAKKIALSIIGSQNPKNPARDDMLVEMIADIQKNPVRDDMFVDMIARVQNRIPSGIL